MKPNEQNLERVLRKLIKQERISASDLLLHWQGLGVTGDRVLIHTLNKQNGWEAFMFWSESEPEVREKLKSISERPGISEAGVLALRSAGMIGSKEETPRSHSLWILQTVRTGEPGEWDQATAIMLQNDDFFYSTLALLELEGSEVTASFFANLLRQPLTREQDQAVRRSLYRLRQKGIEAPRQETTPATVSTETARPEIFVLAHNRLPLWQPFFYYRSTGSRGDWFFAEISEGKVFEIIQQQRDIRMNQKRMLEVADNYAKEFRKGTGVDMVFIPVNPAHARFFLMRSFELVSGSDDFQKYMGAASIEDPHAGKSLGMEPLAADASQLLEHEYFKLWTAEEVLVDRLFEELQQVDDAPIILPEHQMRQRKAELMQQILQEYFTDTKQSVWKLALEKAAYFLTESDPETAGLALRFAASFRPGEPWDAHQNIFTQALVERSLAIQKERAAKEQQEQKRSSLIMSPQEFERSMKTK